MAVSFCDRIRWTEKAFSLTAALQKFETRFPIVVVTCSGFHGHNEAEVISAAEIVRIQSPVSQWRVFAFDSRGRIFSLPLTLRQNFETIRQYGQDSKPKRLNEILDDHELPVRVTFAEDSEHFEIGEMKYNNVKLGFLTLYKLHEERFLRLNSIARGVINKQTLLLPMYVPIEVKVAEGLRDGSVEDWDSIMATFDRTVNSAKTPSLGCLDEVLVYDPTDGKIVNPQASHAIHDRPQCVLAVDPTFRQKSDSKARRHSLSDKLSAIGIRENREPEERYEISDFPNSNTKSAEILQSTPNEKLRKAIERTGFGGDESHQTRTASEKVDKNSKSEAPRFAGSLGDISEEKSRNRTDESNIRSKKTVNGLSGNHGNDAQGDADERNNGKIGEENGADLYFQAVRRLKPLERPTAAERRCAPTGRVSPMVRESSGKSASEDDSGVVSEPTAKFTAFAAAAAAAAAGAKSDYFAWPTATAPPTWQQLVDASVTSTPPQTTEATVSRYGAHVERRNPDVPPTNCRGNDSSLFSAAEPFAASNDGAGRAPTEEAGKKSSLKVDRKRSNRAKRHVSYSDTDTIYPFDSTDDSEVDFSPLFRLGGSGEIGFTGGGGGGGRLNRTPQVRHPLTLRNHRQKGNPLVVVAEHRPPGGLGRRRNTADVFPAMAPQRNRIYRGSDGSTLPPRFGASCRHSSIDVIPETLEEHPASTAGLANDNNYNNRAKEYFEMANLRNFDFDDRRRGASSMISVGGGRNDISMVRPAVRQQQQQHMIDSSHPMSFSKMFLAPEYNQETTNNNNNSLRRQTLNGAGHRSKRTAAVEYIGPNSAASSGQFAWRQEGKTPTLNGMFSNGFLPQPEYRHRIGNIVAGAENQPNFRSKVIRLNETRDGNKWAEISDIERRGLEANGLVYSGATMRRSNNTRHIPSNVATSLEYMPSAGIVSLSARTANNAYDVTRKPTMTQTMPWKASYNNLPLNSSVMERNRPGRKIIPI